LKPLLVPVAAIAAALLCLSPSDARADQAPPLSIYGFARLDLIVDDAPMSDAQRPFYVESEAARTGDSEMSMHPRLTRLGLSIDEWNLAGGIDGEGKLEVDFQNGGTESRAAMQLRHAYFALSIADKLEVLAGQTWDLISPLFPAANNDSLMWNAGNTGDRRPQLRLTATPTDKARIAVAFAMPGAVDAQDLDGDERLDGLEAATPMVQGLVELRARVRGQTPARIGVWGHVGKEELGDGTEYDTGSIGAHFFLPLADVLTLLGEVYRGRNLSDIRGGIGQGVNRVASEEIDATGGWLELAAVITPRHMIALGNTLDLPDAGDLEDGDREKNLTFYAVHRYRPHRALQLGIEYIRWFTAYKNLRNGSANRVNLHLAMIF
jgi:hypothetical protein